MKPDTSEPGAPAPVAIVTGGAQGIGRATAELLLERGYRVAAADIDREAGEEFAAAVAEGDAFAFVATDVADEGSVRALIEEVAMRFGRLDALVNNAGIGANGPLTELSLDAWNRVLGVNLTGAFLCVKHAAPRLRQAKGAVVNIASTRALMSEADTEAYSASKGGILALTHALAISLGPAVRVNAVSPGWIEVRDWQKGSARREPELREVDHAQHPVGRVGRPRDVAAAVAYLLSDAAGFVTGQNVVVDGGMTRKMIYAD